MQPGRNSPYGLMHYSNFERIAMVGDRKWEKWMPNFCERFTKAEVKYFDSVRSRCCLGVAPGKRRGQSNRGRKGSDIGCGGRPRM